MSEQRRRTKIVATMGPASDDDGVLARLIKAGVDVFRVNFSHGSHEDHTMRVEQVRRVSETIGAEVGVLADLAGPKIRIEKFAQSPIELTHGDLFILDAGDPDRPGDKQRVGVSYAGLADDVRVGNELLLDDGLISMTVISIEGREVHCRVDNGGTLSDRKGLNIRGGGLSLSGLTERDIEDIRLAAELDVDFLAVSFPRNAEDMLHARKLLRSHGSKAATAAKIERTEAIANLEEIVDASDAVLVARGDLGVEIGDAELPGLQKQIIRTALARKRIVITATQMMQSMVENPVPTRAEVLDVANAVLDGTDAVMLSAESAVGKYPVRAVEAMQRVCLGAERHAGDQPQPVVQDRYQRIDQVIAMATMFAANNVSVQAIVALTESGSTARWMSRVRSAVPIFALSPNIRSRRQMALYRDVYPVHYQPDASQPAAVITADAIQFLFTQSLLQEGDRVLFTLGDQMGMQGGTNTMKLIRVGADGLPDYQSALDEN